MFLNEIEKQCYGVVFYDATASTSAGLIQVLYENRSNIRLLLIDEICELKKNDIDCFTCLTMGEYQKHLKHWI